MTAMELADKLETSFNGHMLHIDLGREEIEMICKALRGAAPQGPEASSLSLVARDTSPVVAALCRCERFPWPHEIQRLCRIGFNGFLSEVQRRLLEDGYDPPRWPDTIRDQGELDSALDSCTQWCKDRLDEAGAEKHTCKSDLYFDHSCKACVADQNNG